MKIVTKQEQTQLFSIQIQKLLYFLENKKRDYGIVELKRILSTTKTFSSSYWGLCYCLLNDLDYQIVIDETNEVQVQLQWYVKGEQVYFPLELKSSLIDLSDFDYENKFLFIELLKSKLKEFFRD